MYNQHAKWLEKSKLGSLAAPHLVAHLLISSLVWRQDHNGFTHQESRLSVWSAIRARRHAHLYAPDANCLLRRGGSLPAQ